MKWLITGGSGFTGRYLLPTIHKRFPNDEISIIDLKPPQFNLNDKTLFRTVDLLDEIKVKRIVKQINPDRIVHLAALMRNENPYLMTKVNIVTCGTLLEVIRSCNISIDGFLVIGSAAQYGRADPKNPPTEEDLCIPTTFYGYLKLLQEKLALEYYEKYNLPIICVRPANIIGPTMPPTFLIPRIINQLVGFKKNSRSRRCKLTIEHTKAARDFIDVRDISEAYVSLFEHQKTRGETFNIGQNRVVFIEEIIDYISQILNIEKIEIVEEKPREDFDLHLTNSLKIQSFTPWRPETSLKTTLKYIIETSF